MSKNNDGLLRLGEDYTCVAMTAADRDKAIEASIYVTLSEHEHAWTTEQQVLMARYCRWAAQRLECARYILHGSPLREEPA